MGLIKFFCDCYSPVDGLRALLTGAEGISTTAFVALVIAAITRLFSFERK